MGAMADFKVTYKTLDAIALLGVIWDAALDHTENKNEVIACVESNLALYTCVQGGKQSNAMASPNTSERPWTRSRHMAGTRGATRRWGWRTRQLCGRSCLAGRQTQTLALMTPSSSSKRPQHAGTRTHLPLCRARGQWALSVRRDLPVFYNYKLRFQLRRLRSPR